MSEIEFFDAPPPDGRSDKHNYGEMRRFVDALKANPGKWAQYRPGVGHFASTATRLRERYGVQAVSRKRPDGKHDIWAHWPGTVTVGTFTEDGAA